jgi:hypothetical protein
MNSHTLYSIYRLGDEETRKKLLEKIDNIRRNKIILGCSNSIQRYLEMNLVEDFLPASPTVYNSLVGELYTDKEYVIKLLNTKEFPDEVLWSILYVTDTTIETALLHLLPENIIDRAIKGSYFYNDVKHRLNKNRVNKIKILSRMLEVARIMRPHALELGKDD